MIVPIEINSSDILSQFNLNQKQLSNLLDNVAKGLAVIYVGKLEEEVSQGLHSTRSRYLKNIRIIDSGLLQSTVLLDYSKDPLVRMLEEGQGAFDMKFAMLASPKAKVSKTGKRYMSIPLRWSTPGSVGESEVFSSKMPQEIYDIVRKKPQARSLPGGGSTSKGLSFGEIPKQFQQQQVRQEVVDSDGKVLFKEYQHRSPIYQGISKQRDSTTGQSIYNSFRRVSENSDPSAFIHPGIVAGHFMDRAYAKMNLEEEVGLQIDNELIKLGS